MLELLAPSPGDHVLDIGSGSGWQTALLAQIVSSDEYGRPLPKEEAGFVVGLEHIPELAKESMVRLHRFSLVDSLYEKACVSAIARASEASSGLGTVLSLSNVFTII
jgi:protein-L-isoaspartate(D-aspartate) O-methyltransferase